MTSTRLTSGAVLVLALATAGCGSASSARDVASEETPVAPVAEIRTSTEASPKKTTPASGIVETTFDDLKFPMEKTDAFADSMLTDRVRSLFGQRIRIRGYMYPTPQKRGIKQFVLVRDNMECCFGPGAALFDCVLVSMRDGAAAEFSIRPIAVEGEFRFDPLTGPDGRPLAIFQMSGDNAE